MITRHCFTMNPRWMFELWWGEIRIYRASKFRTRKKKSVREYSMFLNKLLSIIFGFLLSSYRGVGFRKRKSNLEFGIWNFSFLWGQKQRIHSELKKDIRCTTMYLMKSDPFSGLTQIWVCEQANGGFNCDLLVSMVGLDWYSLEKKT